jgi:hypothetical protein
MHLRQVIYCVVLIGVFGMVAKTTPPGWRELWQKFVHALSSLARHKTPCWIGVGVLVLIIRAALLAVWPIPKPSIYDEFSYLLQADTFAHGHLTNPPHPLWKFFESPYILQQPTYASRFPPAQALVMAAGQVFLGHPWFGVWLSAALLAASLCWALQGWLPPGWALLGTFIGLNLCLFSYWMNSYWGGAVTAIGGALVTGAWVRIMRAKRLGYAWVFGVGAVIVMLARPFEGLLLVAPALITMVIANRTMRVWLPIVLTGLAGASWLMYDNYRVTGHALQLPYRQYYQQYEVVPPFSFMPLSTPLPGFRHFAVNELWTRETFDRVRSWHLLVDRPLDWLTMLRYYYGNLIWLLPLLAFAPSVWRSRRTRFATILTVLIGVASLVEMWWYPHYAAPFMAAFLVLAVQSLRYLAKWKYHGHEVGRFLVGAIPVAVLAVMVASQAEAIVTHQTSEWVRLPSAQKGTVEQRLLEKYPGHHVIFVRHTGTQIPSEAWIYNPADIDAAPVIWAWDLGQAENGRLRAYFQGRSFWLFKPDESMSLSRY